MLHWDLYPLPLSLQICEKVKRKGKDYKSNIMVLVEREVTWNMHAMKVISLSSEVFTKITVFEKYGTYGNVL